MGSAKVPLYPLLKAMGADDEQIHGKWGGQILERNKTSDTATTKTIGKFARKVFGDKRAANKTPEELTEMVNNHFTVESHLNPKVSRLTLGEAYDRVTPSVVLAGTGRILELQRGTGVPDSRDEIYFKRFRDLPETGREYLAEHAEALKRRLARRIEKDSIPTGDLRGSLGPGEINPTVKSIFTRTKLQGAGETPNILDLMSADS